MSIFPLEKTSSDEGNSYKELLSNLTTSPHTTTHCLFDEPNYTVDDVTKADMKIIILFGDFYHQNYESHLGSRTKDDEVWQWHWQTLTDQPIQEYDLMTGVARRRFIDTP